MGTGDDEDGARGERAEAEEDEEGERCWSSSENSACTKRGGGERVVGRRGEGGGPTRRSGGGERGRRRRTSHVLWNCTSAQSWLSDLCKHSITAPRLGSDFMKAPVSCSDSPSTM